MRPSLVDELIIAHAKYDLLPPQRLAGSLWPSLNSTYPPLRPRKNLTNIPVHSVQPLDRMYGEPTRYRASALFLTSCTLLSVAKSVFSILHYYYVNHHAARPSYTWCSTDVYGTRTPLCEPEEKSRPQKNTDACSHSWR